MKFGKKTDEDRLKEAIRKADQMPPKMKDALEILLRGGCEDPKPLLQQIITTLEDMGKHGGESHRKAMKEYTERIVQAVNHIYVDAGRLGDH